MTRLIIPLLVVLACGACARVKVDPIHITIDINIKVDRALDDFFAAVKAPAPAPSSTNATSL